LIGGTVKVTREKTENSQAFLTIEMETTEVEQSLAESYRRLAKRANIPGFRKGKAPKAVLERFLGKESFIDDALNRLIPQAYEKALADEQIEAFARPQIEVVQTEPVIFKATVPLTPVIELGDFHSIRLTPEPVEVNQDQVDAVIEQLRHQNAAWESVDRAVDFDDLAVLDIESSVDGEAFINRGGAQFYVRQEATFPAPGFAEQLAGMKKDEEKEFRLSLPQDYTRNEIAGKEVAFKVRVAEVKQEILPELNDEFAKKLGPELETVAALRDEVQNNLKLRAEEQTRNDFEEKVIQAAIDQAQVEFPPVLVEMETHRLIEEQARRFQMQGGNLEEYLKRTDKTEEQLHEELHPVAERRVTQALVLGKVAEAEKVEASDAEIDAEIENTLKNAAERKEELRQAFNTPQSRDSLKQILLTRKTVNRLAAIAKGEEANTEAKEEKK
jgi:trigger factor